MVWTRLEHAGPSYAVVTTKRGVLRMASGQKHNLDETQLYLLNVFWSNYYPARKRDPTFVKNFWTSLLKRQVVMEPQEGFTFTRLSNPKESIRYTNTEGTIVLNNERKPMMGRLEPPSIFVGRDERHPLRGTCKRGVGPKDVVLNMSRNATTRARERGFTRFVHQRESNWIACWKDSVTGDMRYIYMDNVDSPEEKFENARRLCRKLPKVRSEYKKTPVDAQSRQFMVALFLIERCCIRVGNKKDETSQGNTVGCCTLRAHTHVWVAKNECHRRVRIAFIGKDSIKYENTVTLPNELFAIVLELLNAKKVGAVLFDALNPGIVNRLLHERIMPGVTAKTFRTMRASMLFETVLHKSNDLKRANADVATLLNHKTHKGDKLNLQTSRNNYIDPRIYFAYRATSHNGTKGWFENHAHWAGNTPSSFKFKK